MGGNNCTRCKHITTIESANLGKYDQLAHCGKCNTTYWREWSNSETWVAVSEDRARALQRNLSQVEIQPPT
jgi:hypothetical protein